MNDDLFQSVSQRSIGAQDAENRRIEAVADELRRRCKLYEAQRRDGQSLPVNAFADGSYIVSLCRVIELKIYRIVHVSELVNVVKTYLERHHVAIIITSFFCHLC